MKIDTMCERCKEWVPPDDTDPCLDCGGLICLACRPTHMERRYEGATYLTCQPHTDEEVARILEGEA